LGAADEPISTTSRGGPLIDTHVYLGRWPHARLAGDAPHELVAALRRNQVSQAWVGSFDGLFHKDIDAVNQRLADFCAQQDHGLLIPYGTVNPTLPDWEEDLRRCHEQFHMPGIRLHPNYHGYTLDDPRFARLLAVAAGSNVIVQLVAWVDDARHKWLMPTTAEVDLKPLAPIIKKLPKLRLVIAGSVRTFNEEAVNGLLLTKQVYFDIARLANGDLLMTFMDRSPTDRIIFGSGAPLHSIESVRAKLQAARLSDEQRNAIAGRTAATLIGAR
jgi:predicted TIM-barrel fold metal-dependent hydrolase